MSRLPVSVFCPVLGCQVEFVYVTVDGAPDLAWCQRCFMVTEVTDLPFECPRAGQWLLPRR